jgi:hypothetical protein
MADTDRTAHPEVTRKDVRAAPGRNGSRARSLPARARADDRAAAPAWDWSADELSVDELAELRAGVSALRELVAELERAAARTRERERELRERVATEEAEAIARIQSGFADVERRQVDQLKRIVERTSSSFSDALSRQFSEEVKRAREGAAQRLSRELDRAVEQFSREAQTVLAERLAHVADAGGQRLERKLSAIASTLEQQQDELVAELQRRITDADAELRTQLQAVASEAEAERTILNARLNELRRRIEDLLGEAESRTAPTFRAG